MSKWHTAGSAAARMAYVRSFQRKRRGGFKRRRGRRY